MTDKTTFPIDQQIAALDRACSGLTFELEDMRAALRTLQKLKAKRDQPIYPFAEIGKGLL